MSTTIDQRVVEMRFDNKHFEQNVQTSMSTLDKLKQKLHLTGASKGLENVSSAAKKVDISPLGNAVETVKTKFSAMEVIGVTALANITNSAVNAGKRIVSALTIDPVKSGFREYETQINAVQTILANTQKEGADINKVNAALDELNKYADQTIYNFTEMTRNIGTFTAAGVKLDTSVNAIKGIANLAAVSGSTSQQASTAMYQLSQALASGTVKLMDWNSVVNAGMGGQVFQDSLKETARIHGVNIDAMIEKEGSFRETLKNGWLSSDILTETLEKFTYYAEEGTAEWNEYMEALKQKGYTEEQAKEILKLGKTATEAATKVKTFTQLWDVLKEAAQSGWAQTWRLIIGDFEEAKALFTPIADFLTGLINKMSNARNSLLESALGKNFKAAFDKVRDTLNPVTKAVDTVTGALKDYDKVVDEIIDGKWGHTQERWDALTAAGYDWAHAQNLVNERLGSSVRRATSYNEAQGEVAKTQSELSDVEKQRIIDLAEMSEAELRALGYTEEQIAAFRELKIQAEKLGIPLKDFIDNIDEINGRWVLINSFKNIGKGLIAVFSSIGKAWREIFDPITGDQLYDIIAGFHKFTTHLVMSDENADKLKRTFKGLFAILDMVTTVIGGGFKMAFKIISSVLGYFDLNILDVTAAVGDAIVKFHDWFESIFDISKVLDVVVPFIQKIIGKFKEWIGVIKESDIASNIISGLVNGLQSGAKAVWDAAVNIGKKVLEAICNFLGIHSPSTKFIEVGENIIAGLVNGIKNGFSAVWGVIKGLASGLINIVGNIDWGKVLALGLGAGMFIMLWKLVDVLKKLASPFEAVTNLLDSVGDMFDGLGKSFKASAMKKKSQAVLNFAIAIGILAASMILLSKLDWGGVLKASVALLILSGVVVGLAFAVDKIGSADGKIVNTKLSSLLIMAGSLFLLAIAVKKLSTVDINSVPSVLITFAAIIGGMLILIKSFEKLAKTGDGMIFKSVGGMLLKMSIAMLLMMSVIKNAAKLDGGDVIKGLAVVAGIELLFAGIIAVSKMAGQHATKAGGMILKMSIAILLMIGIIKQAAKLDGDDVLKGLGVVAGIELLFAGIIAVSKFAGEHAGKAGRMLLMMSLALLIAVSAVKSAAKLNENDVMKGLAVVSALELLFIGLIAASKLAGEHAVKAGFMLLTMSAALLIVVGILFIVSQMDPNGLYRSLAVVSTLELMFMGLIAVTYLAKDVKTGTLVMLVASIALLAGALVGLSFLDPNKLAVAAGSMVAVMAGFALMLKSSGSIKNAPGMIKTMGSLLLVVAGLAAILGVMSILNVKASIPNAIALGILLNAMAAAMVILNRVSPTASKGVGALALMGLVVGELAIILGLMSHFDVEPSIETATSLSILLLAMSGALVILGAVGATGSAAFIGIGALATLIAGVGLIVVALGALQDKFPAMEKFIDTGIPILEKIGYALGSFFGNIVGGFLSGTMSGLPDMGTYLSQFMTNIQPFIDGAKQLDESVFTGVKALAETILILTKAEILDGIAGWLTGGNSLADFANQLVPFAEGMVKFSEAVSGKIDESSVAAATNAGKLLSELQNSLPRTGGWIQEVAGEKDLAAFGKACTAFGESISEFSKSVTGENTVDPAATEAAANAGMLMSELQNSLPRTGGWIQEIAGEKDLVAFGKACVAFGEAIAKFSKSVTGENVVDVEAAEAAANAGMLMSELQSSLPRTGGWISEIAGEKDLAAFGNSCVAFGAAIVAFSKSISGENAIDTDTAEQVVNAGTLLSELQNTLPRKGGWISEIAGEKDLGEFGLSIAAFGSAISEFSKNIGDGIDEGAVESAANAGKMMAELQAAIPTDKWLDGKVQIDDFGEKIKKFGEHLVSYADEVSEIDGETVGYSITQANRLTNLAKSVADIDTDNIDKFKKVKGIGTAMKDYSAEVSGINAEVVSSSVDSANKLKSLVNSLNSVDPSGISNFKVQSIGNAMGIYASHVRSLNPETVDGSISAAYRLKSLINSLAGIDTSGVGSFKSAIEELGTISVDKVVQAFSGANSKLSTVGGDLINSISKGMTSKQTLLISSSNKMLSEMHQAITSKYEVFHKVGVNLMGKLLSGISTQKSRISKAISTLMTSIITATNAYYSKFYAAGGYLVDGFANGISANTYKAKAKAKAMAKAAEDAAKRQLDEHSPSKVFYQIGAYAGEGFVNAFGDYATESYKASSELAASARSGLSDAIRKVYDVINSDMDMQPTIRPVLDLSDVQAGAGTLGGLFGGSTIGVSARVDRLSGMMNQYGQNGVNSDVVSAIDKLSKKLSNMGNVTYNNVNGVTYDDGSNITDAVKTLVRAAKIERRI